MLSHAPLAKQAPTPKASVPAKPAQTMQAETYFAQNETELLSPQFAYSLAGVRTFAEGEHPEGSMHHFTNKRLPFPIQAKLRVGAVNDPLETEADLVADQVMRMPEPRPALRSSDQNVSADSLHKPSADANRLQRKCDCGGTCDDCKTQDYKMKDKHGEHAKLQMKGAGPSVTGGFAAPPIVHDVLRSPGQPLDAATRAFMEPRFGHDFSRVRIHTDARAAESATAVGAKAYTVGNHLVFGLRQFSPVTESGRRLLGHELTHVIQQKSDYTLHGQPLNQPTPGFSVNQADYLQLVTQAIQSISGNLVHTNTLAPIIQPALSSLVSQAIWRDEKGKESGGKEVAVPLPGTPKVVLQLRLVLDDQADPKLAGEFEHKGADKTHGAISVMVRKATDASLLKNILFHEASHMLVWAMENWGAERFRGQDRASVRALNLSLHSREIEGIQRQLETLATSVNSRRAAGQPKIAIKTLDSTARWLLNEAEVRAETKVFELYSDTQNFLAQRGPKIFVDTSKIIGIDSAMIDLYVFDMSKVFLPSDRGGLTADDKQVLNTLRDILVGIADLQVKRQFNITPYIIGQGIPPAPVNIPVSPLPSPQFRPLPLP
jgi:hypothetical protein